LRAVIAAGVNARFGDLEGVDGERRDIELARTNDPIRLPVRWPDCDACFWHTHDDVRRDALATVENERRGARARRTAHAPVTAHRCTTSMTHREEAITALRAWGFGGHEE
jgi:hypothetical protein